MMLSPLQTAGTKTVVIATARLLSILPSGEKMKIKQCFEPQTLGHAKTGQVRTVFRSLSQNRDICPSPIIASVWFLVWMLLYCRNGIDLGSCLCWMMARKKASALMLTLKATNLWLNAAIAQRTHNNGYDLLDKTMEYQNFTCVHTCAEELL